MAKGVFRTAVLFVDLHVLFVFLAFLLISIPSGSGRTTLALALKKALLDTPPQLCERKEGFRTIVIVSCENCMHATCRDPKHPAQLLTRLQADGIAMTSDGKGTAREGQARAMSAVCVSC